MTRNFFNNPSLGLLSVTLAETPGITEFAVLTYTT